MVIIKDIYLLVFNNNITLQWGNLRIYSSTAGNKFLHTLPTAFTAYASITINGGVGTSGWPYMNGIQAYYINPTQIQIYHCLGNANPSGEYCSWIAIGF